MEQFDSPELSEFRKTVRTWLEANSPKDWKKEASALSTEDRRAVLAKYAQRIREPGWLAPHWPKEFGGAGLTSEEQIVLKQEMVRADYPPAGGGIAFHHAAATIMAYGTPEQVVHLEAILDGEVWCQGFSEPEAGSDLASLRTKAVRDGDTYVLNGQKIWSSGAQYSQWSLLLARTDPTVAKHKGISIFMVDLSLPGIEVRPIKQATGGSEFCEIFLNDVVIPASSRLGPENEGWKIAQTTLSTERWSFIIENQVRLQEAIEKLIVEAHGIVVAPGVTAYDDRAIRQELGERAAEVEALGMLADEIIGSFLRDGSVATEGSVVKVLYSETLQKLTGLAARIRGIASDSGVEGGRLGEDWASGEWLVDHIGSWTWTIAAGSNEIQRNIIGERILGLPREPQSSAVKTA
jgi:alkylation response protein AidB-like acyl-CoA dehydrogenase